MSKEISDDVKEKAEKSYSERLKEQHGGKRARDAVSEFREKMGWN